MSQRAGIGVDEQSDDDGQDNVHRVMEMILHDQVQVSARTNQSEEASNVQTGAKRAREIIHRKLDIPLRNLHGVGRKLQIGEAVKVAKKE